MTKKTKALAQAIETVQAALMAKFGASEAMVMVRDSGVCLDGVSAEVLVEEGTAEEVAEYLSVNQKQTTKTK